MKYSLFGKNITPSCDYCHNNINGECIKNKVIKNNKCRKFSYNPLMRVPINEPPMMKFKPEDFMI